MQDVEVFRDSLADLPDFAISMGDAGTADYALSHSALPSSRSGILRFTRAMFGVVRATGYLKLDPMALMNVPASRELNVFRAINLDLYETVLQMMGTQDSEELEDLRGYLRDRCILVCLRESGLRASELVGAAMGAFKQFADPKARKTYWVLGVVFDNAKSGKARTVCRSPNKGQDMRSVAARLGHSSVNPTMAYTGQETLDLVRAVETAEPNRLSVVPPATKDPVPHERLQRLRFSSSPLAQFLLREPARSQRWDKDIPACRTQEINRSRRVL